MSTPIRHPFTEFVNLLSAHPFYKTVAGANYVVDVTGLCSSKAPYRYVGPYTDSLVKELTTKSAEEYDLYYHINYHRVRSNRHISTADISNALFILLDFDYKLPYSIGKLLEEVGIMPWSIVQTSSAPHNKYQCLIAIAPEDSNKVDHYSEVSLLAASTLGSDRATTDLVRIARLPGFKNWKGATKGENRGVAKLIESASPAVAYTYKELERKLRLAAHNDIVLECQAAVPASTRAAITLRESSIAEGRLLKFPIGWKEALEAAKQGKASAFEYERHTAASSWAGSLINEAVLGRLGKEQALKTLLVLCKTACSDNWYSSSKREAKRLLEWTSAQIDSGKEVRQVEYAAFIANRIAEGLGVLPALPANGSNGSNGHGHSAIAAAEGLVEEEAVTQEEQAEDQTRKRKMGYAMFFEEDDTLVDFLIACFFELKRLQHHTGYTENLVELILARARSKQLIVDAFFCVPAKQRSRWGTVCNYQFKFVSAAETQFITNLVERIYGAIRDKHELLVKDLRIAERLAAEEIRIREKCTSALDGSVDEVSFRNEWAAAKVGFFTIKCKRDDKKDLVKELKSTVACEKQGDDSFIVSKSAAITFQNGRYDVSSGEFKRGEAWKDTLSSVFVSFDVRVGKATAACLRNSSVNSAYEQLLLRYCPAMHRFLTDTFPMDIDTWILVFTIAGYCLLETNEREKFFNFQGVGGSGKSSLARMIRNIAGQAAAKDIEFARIPSDAGGLMACVGKAVAIIDEVDSASMDRKSYNAAFTKLKQVTGSSYITVRKLYQDEVKVQLGTKFIVISNEPLKFLDKGGAGERRIVPLKFDEMVTPAKRVADIDVAVLKDGEGNAADCIATIAAVTLRYRWSLGDGMFSAEGSKALKEGTDSYLESSSPIKAHLRDIIVADKQTTLLPLCVLVAAVDVYAEDSGDSTELRGYAADRLASKERLVQDRLKELGFKYDYSKDRVKDSKGRNVKYQRGLRVDCSKVDINLILKRVYELYPEMLGLVVQKASKCLEGADTVLLKRYADTLL